MTPSELKYLDKSKILAHMIVMNSLQVDHLDISVITAHIHGDN